MKYILTIILCLTVNASIAQRDTIHVVFKTHLDIGFTDMPQNVVNKYLHEYLPQAIKTGREMQKLGTDRFIWTTGSWIIYEYLRTATADQKFELESAIRDNLLTWNAYPFTFDSELADAELFRHALTFSKNLDIAYGKKTCAAKITDVPGETVSSIHLLNEQGIKLLHIGVNPASARPETPAVFLWKDGTGGEIVVLYHGDYDGTFSVPGFNHTLHFEFTGDNKGPQTPEQVQSIFKNLRQKFPNSVVIASTMDNFAREIWKIKDRLPEVTGEIGNTWIHSAGTDPLKYAQLRALMRLRTKWIANGRDKVDAPAFSRFSTNLLLATEHTGGLDEKLFLDFDHYNVAELQKVINQPGYQKMIQSWNYARSYITQAVQALGDSPLAQEARNELAAIQPIRPELSGFKSFSLSKPLITQFFEIRFDPVTGAITSITDRQNKAKLTMESQPVGLFWHQSFSGRDYQRFFNQYLQIQKEWAYKDFGKPNIDQHGAISGKQYPKVSKTFFKKTSQGHHILVQLELPQDTDYGLPAEIWLQIEFPSNKKEINYTVQWFNKKACRLPEAYWFSMGFNTPKPEAWQIEKFDRMISPLEVIPKGGRSLHAFNRGVFYNDGSRGIEVESPDCPIVAPGEPSLLDFSDQLPDLSKGWHFNLFNNKWGTNFPTWYSDDARFRFTIRFSN